MSCTAQHSIACLREQRQRGEQTPQRALLLVGHEQLLQRLAQL
jgi:hypothetical protein